MLLLVHVTLALSSLVLSGYMYFRPSQAKLRTTYGLTALTVASGTYLIISTKAQLLHSCLMGLLYLGVVFYGIIATHRQLARADARR